MNMRINPKLEIGTFHIVCSKCGYLLYGPEYGDRTKAALKAMELYPKGTTCPSCGGEVTIELNLDERPNMYSKDHPYIIQKYK